MVRQSEITKSIKILKNTINFVEEVINDSVYYGFGWLYLGLLSTIILTSIFLPVVLILLFPMHIALKVFLHVYKVKEDICKRKERNYWWTLDGWEFEEEVAAVLRDNGFQKVKVTKKTGDGGIDLSFTRNGLFYIIQCKHFKTPVPVEPVRALWAVKEDFNADRVIMIASSGVTYAGKEFIKRRGSDYLLWTLDDIINMSNNVKE